MILYLEPSALVKRYVSEPGSDQVREAISQAELTGTALISRAEVAAALAKAARADALTRDEALAGLRLFRKDWPDLVRVQVTDLVVARVDTFAWEHGLRGYDAIHLAAASVWQEVMGGQVTFATFHQHLWTASESVGLGAFPPDLPAILQSWEEASASG